MLILLRLKFDKQAAGSGRDVWSSLEVVFFLSGWQKLQCGSQSPNAY